MSVIHSQRTNPQEQKQNNSIITDQQQSKKVYDPQDEWCFNIFIFLTLVQIGICIVAFYYGDPTRLGQAYDADHNACGVDPGFQNYPYIYFTTPFNNTLYKTVCVSNCPKLPQINISCIPNTVVESCEQYLDPTEMNESVLVYNSFPYKNSICLPAPIQFYNNVQSALNFNSNLNVVIGDFYSSQKLILLVTILAIACSVGVYYFFLKFAKFLVLLIFFLIILFCAGGSLVLYLRYVQASKAQESALTNDTQYSFQEVWQSFDNKAISASTDLTFSILLLSFLVIFTLIIRYKHKQIKQAIDIFDLSSIILKSNQQLINVYLVVYLIMLVALTLAFFTIVYVSSCGQIRDKPYELPYNQFKLYAFSQYGLIYSLIYFPYLISAIAECSQFITAGTCEIWYKTEINEQDHKIKNPAYQSAFNLYKQHLGQVLFSNFVLIILFPFRFPVEVLSSLYQDWSTTEQQKAYQNQQNTEQQQQQQLSQQQEQQITQQPKLTFLNQISIILKPFDIIREKIMDRFNNQVYVFILIGDNKPYWLKSSICLVAKHNHNKMYNYFSIVTSSFSFYGSGIIAFISATVTHIAFNIDQNLMYSVTSDIPTVALMLGLGFWIGQTIMTPIGTIPDYLLTLYTNEFDMIDRIQYKNQEIFVKSLLDQDQNVFIYLQKRYADYDRVKQQIQSQSQSNIEEILKVHPNTKIKQQLAQYQEFKKEYSIRNLHLQQITDKDFEKLKQELALSKLSINK